MQGLSKPLAAQRLLLFGLLAVMACSAFLLWKLRSGNERGAGTTRGLASETRRGETAREREALSSPGEDGAGGSIPVAEAARTSNAPEPVSKEEPEPSFDPGALVGLVRSRGEPVANVELRLYDPESERSERRAPLAETRSDAHGRFRLSGWTPHRRYALHLQHPDYSPSEEELFPGHVEEFELEPTVQVAGTVVAAESGRALAGVEVALERWHFEGEGMRERVSTFSDEAGRWRLPWARAGIERFLVLRPGFLPERREFQVGARGGDGFEIRLGGATALVLELHELESDALLTDTEVLSDGVRVRTDASGRLSIPAPEPSAGASLRISLALEGGCMTLGRLESDALPPLLRLPLARGGTVSGRVLDAEGRGLGGARVRVSGGGRSPPGLALPEGFQLYPARSGTLSGDDGHYELGGLPPRDRPLEVSAEHREHPPGRSEPFDLRELGAHVEVDVTLAKGGTLAGVTRVDGEPASVRVFWSGARRGGWTRSNDRGEYRLVGVPSGEISLRARLEREDEDLPRAEDQTLLLEEGAGLTADFDLASGRARIVGRVLDPRGAPVAEAEVVASAADEGEWLEEEPRTQSGSDGRFELFVPEQAGLLFDLSAESGPRRAALPHVRAGQDVELVLPALGTLSLRVLDASSRAPVQGFQLYWRTSEEGRFERYSVGGRRLSPGANGEFQAELPCGRLDLAVSVRSQGYLTEQRDGLEILEGRTTPLELRLDHGFELELEFHAPPGDEEALRTLRRGRYSIASEEQWATRARGGDLFQEDVRNAQALRLDDNGVAHLKGLAAGPYRFYGTPRGYDLQPGTFEMPPVALHRQKVTLEPVQERKPGAPGR